MFFTLSTALVLDVACHLYALSAIKVFHETDAIIKILNVSYLTC